MVDRGAALKPPNIILYITHCFCFVFFRGKWRKDSLWDENQCLLLPQETRKGNQFCWNPPYFLLFGASPLNRGHANLPCIVPVLVYVLLKQALVPHLLTPPISNVHHKHQIELFSLNTIWPAQKCTKFHNSLWDPIQTLFQVLCYYFSWTLCQSNSALY